MTNAKKEFLEHIEDRDVICAKLKMVPEYLLEECKFFSLPSGFTTPQLDVFLANINFEYDSGYGGQNLFGYIWYGDGTWSERGEYDGSEWWEHKACPPIPNELLQRPIES